MRWRAYVFIGLTMGASSLSLAGADSASPSDHWAFRPLTRTGVPAATHPIDAFVQQRLNAEGLAPSPEAQRETLLRRLSLDLIGLPPTLEERDAFLSDSAPDAYDKQVDRLLASPHFGEKWARGWLDLAAYADSDGYLSDFLRPQAWRYRDWVMRAFNENKPFDQFTIEQIAGDLLPGATLEQQMGTGFFRNTLSNREGGADLEEFRVRQIVARTSMLGTAWMGLTVGCAQCHDHKFDPISQREFFGLYAFFNNADEINVDVPAEDPETYAAARAKYEQERQALLAPVAQELDALQLRWEERVLDAGLHPETAEYVWARAYEVLGLIWGQNEGEGQLEGTLILKTALAERRPSQRERLQDYFLQQGSPIDEGQWKTLGLAELTKQLDALRAALPRQGRAPTLMESREHRVTHLHGRGNFRDPKEEVAPDTPSILPPLDPAGTPTRLNLAKWLVRPDHPLTARVAVNRIWQELFGRGLVHTSEDFGTRGTPPSHPELLDWLAVEFIESGWDVKRLIRLIVTSHTYRQSSHHRPELDTRDPENILLARQSRLRLTGELVRDAALHGGGILNAQIGGPSVRPPQPDSVSMEGFMNTWTPSEGPDRYRRGLYTFLQRTSPYGQLITFDLPDPGMPCTRRDSSNTPLQALNLLNDSTFVDAARGLAARVQSFALRRMAEGGSATIEDCIDHAFRIALSRQPTDEERDRLGDYLAQQTDLYQQAPEEARLLQAAASGGAVHVEPAAWTALCSVILNLDEFITRE